MLRPRLSRRYVASRRQALQVLWDTTRLDVLDLSQLETTEIIRVGVPPGLPLNSRLAVRHAPPGLPFVPSAPRPVAYAPPVVERAFVSAATVLSKRVAEWQLRVAQ